MIWDDSIHIGPRELGRIIEAKRAAEIRALTSVIVGESSRGELLRSIKQELVATRHSDVTSANLDADNWLSAARLEHDTGVPVSLLSGLRDADIGPRWSILNGEAVYHRDSLLRWLVKRLPRGGVVDLMSLRQCVADSFVLGEVQR